jgi:hypothetical protein
MGEKPVARENPKLESLLRYGENSVTVDLSLLAKGGEGGGCLCKFGACIYNEIVTGKCSSMAIRRISERITQK